MKLSVPKEIIYLSLAFLLIFAGFGGIQQYVTIYFSKIGLPALGFQSLILIYLFFMISDPASAAIISKYGAKKSMIIAVIFYALYSILLITKIPWVIFIASVFLGISASMLWTGQNSYLIRASAEENLGSNSGFFGALNLFGAAMGIIIVGFIIKWLSYDMSFLFGAILPCLGITILLKLKDHRKEKAENHFHLIKKSILSKTAWQFSIIGFSVHFISGLTIGFIPLEISKTLGILYVGGLSSLFYIMPIFLSILFGKLSDVKGRKGILMATFIICFFGLISLYFSQHVIFLIIGIILLALFRSMSYSVTFALIGDVSTKHNLEYLTAFFWMVQNIGTVSALILSTIIRSNTIYVITITILIIALIILTPLLRHDLSAIKQKISHEVH